MMAESGHEELGSASASAEDNVLRELYRQLVQENVSILGPLVLSRLWHRGWYNSPVATPSEDEQPELEQVPTLQEGIDMLTAKVDSLTAEVNAKVDGIRQDLGEVRGGHARNVVLRNATLVASSLDCRLITEVPQGIILGFSRVAADNNEPSNDVKSFQRADLVLYVSDDRGHPRYLAVEASFTVAGHDIDRAVRNANYLTQYTGLQADPVVAGVQVLPEAQERIDRGEALLYRIERRDLQPD